MSNTKEPDPRRFTPPFKNAKPTHYECNCGGSCETNRGHDLCEHRGGAAACYCDQLDVFVGDNDHGDAIPK